MIVFKQLFIILAFVLSSHSFASKVLKVNKKKNFVVIDSGQVDGVRKRDKYCIFSKSGARVACGIIMAVKKTKSALKVKKSWLRYVSKGMNVEEWAAGRGKERSFVQVFGGFAPISPSAYNQVFYVTPGPDTTSFWEADGVVENSVGFGLELGMALSIPIVVGGRLFTNTEIFSKESHLPNQGDSYVEINHQGQAMGVWLDVPYFNKKSGALFLRIGNGLDIDFSGVRLTSAVIDEQLGTEARSMDVSSIASTISVRGRFEVGFETESVSVSLGAIAFLPLASLGQSLEATFDAAGDSNFEGVDDAEALDMVSEALDHRKAGFGLAITLGLTAHL